MYLFKILGGNIRPPAANPNGTEYVVDTLDNNWRAIRILNSSMNWVYGEWVNHNWTETNLMNPTFYALFDLKKDPWQMTNLYDATNKNTLNTLHSMLMDIGSCTGETCP